MKKTHFIFIGLIVLELIVLSYIYLDIFKLNPECKSACAFKPSFLTLFQPADFVESEICIARCDYFLPSVFYVWADLLIITIVVYAIYLIYYFVKKKGKKL